MQVDFFDPAPPPRVRQDLNLVLLLACSSLILPVNPDAPPKPNVMWNTDRGFLQAAFGPTCDGEAVRLDTCDPSFPFPACFGERTTALGCLERYPVRFRWELAVEQNDEWYGFSSPWTDQQFDCRHDFGGPLIESAPRSVIVGS